LTGKPISSPAAKRRSARASTLSKDSKTRTDCNYAATLLPRSLGCALTLPKRKRALQAQDIRNVRKYLELAEPEAEKIEKFLGR